MKDFMKMNSKSNEVYSIAAMELKPFENSPSMITSAVVGDCERFSRAAEVLPKGGCLGWQLTAMPGEKPELALFSSTNVKASSDDFNWIFQKSVRIESIRQDTLKWMNIENSKVYALRYEPKPNDENTSKRRNRYMRSYGLDLYDDDDYLPNSYFVQLLDGLTQSGAIMRFAAGAELDGNGVILLSLANEMSLRLRTMLSLAFTDTVAMEITDPNEIDQIPLQCVEEYMARLLSNLLYVNAVEKQKEEESFEENDDEDQECDSKGVGATTCSGIQDTPIEELDLSVRAYNCLKRAGIGTVEALRGLTGDELLQIRNLGRKCVAEIKEKLSAHTALSAPVPLTAPSYADMLSELIGLQNVKEQLRKIAAFARMKQDMATRGMAQVPVVLNMEFVGNPGTAKTTVARILAGMFHEMGLLSGSELVEVGRADLVARYEGQTADKVKTVFQKAKGKLLFIDEAYALVENWEGEFGDEAINTIVQEMENNRENTVVIFAGYPEKMEGLFARNPGLRSRVPFHICFSDYSADEMAQIAELEASKRGFSIQPEARTKVLSICESATHNSDVGNGRFCRNLVESAILRYASREYSGVDAGITNNFSLTAEDFSSPAILERKTGVPIGFKIPEFSGMAENLV